MIEYYKTRWDILLNPRSSKNEVATANTFLGLTNIGIPALIGSAIAFVPQSVARFIHVLQFDHHRSNYLGETIPNLPEGEIVLNTNFVGSPLFCQTMSKDEIHYFQGLLTGGIFAAQKHAHGILEACINLSNTYTDWSEGVLMCTAGAVLGLVIGQLTANYVLNKKKQ